MSVFNREKLEKITGGYWHGNEVIMPITGFCHDTRLLRPGEVFLAQKTDQKDGHDCLRDALQKGAAAAIVEQVDEGLALPQLKVKNSLEAFQKIARVHRIEFQGKVVGITGSCGKTTTKDLVSHLLGNDRTHSNYKNWNNLMGVPLTLTGINFERDEYAVVEAGMNQRHEMERLAWMIEPDLTIITQVAPAHLEFIGSVEDVAWEKACLARSMSPNGQVLFPASCLQYEPFRNFNGKARVLVRQGEPVPNLPESQVFRYNSADLGPTTQLVLHFPDGQEYEYYVPAFSPGMTSNFALALMACHLLGVDQAQLTKNLSTWTPSEHRGQFIQKDGISFYADCYNANPVAMRDAFSAFNRITEPDQDRLYVLGCMGELGPESERYHYEVGHSLRLRSQDRVLIIGQDAKAFARGLWDAGNSGDQITCLSNREEITSILNEFKGSVLLKGSKVYKLWEFLPKNELEVTEAVS